MKRVLMAAALACVLSGTVLAGDIPGVDAPAPGDVPTTDAQAPGDMPAVDSTNTMTTCGLSLVVTLIDLAF
jgi:hypothetical protein